MIRSPDSQFTFRGQRDGERVILLLHRHPWALAKAGLWTMAGLVFIILMFAWFQASRPAVWTLFIVGPVLLLYAIYQWYLWWYTLYLVTNERIIVMMQSSLWSRRIEDYNLEKIQSVVSDSKGFAATVLNFGDVMIAIMGIKEPVRMKYIEDAYSIQEKILTAIKKAGL